MKLLDILMRGIPGWYDLWDTDGEVFTIHDRVLGWIKNVESSRREEFKAVREKVREWRTSQEMERFAQECRTRFLLASLDELLVRFRENRERYISAIRDHDEFSASMLKPEAEKLSKKIEQCRNSIRYVSVPDKITPEMVDRARDYPISSIVDVNAQGRAVCVFHDGKDRNMDVRNNFAYCYVCGEHGDAISVYQAVNRCGFREAVYKLN